MNAQTREAECAAKLQLVRDVLGTHRAVRLRGVDWFAWITAGGSSTVLLAAECGVAEVVVTPHGAWVVTDEIEAGRLMDEEIPAGFAVRALPWAKPDERDRVVRALAEGRTLLSDRPAAGEGALPEELVAVKRTMTVTEIERYREVGRLAAQAMTEVLTRAKPEWSELRLSGAGAEALLARGLDPTLVMAAGERRLRLYRHPMPKDEPIGRLAMLVFCGRGRGLYANLTRFVSFGPLDADTETRHGLVREVEARALGVCRPGMPLREVYAELAAAYAAVGDEHAIREHHQGGSTGYLSREVIATPASGQILSTGTAVAFNPSLVGAKVEDTFVVTERGLVNLTLDPEWPTTRVAERERPVVLQL